MAKMKKSLLRAHVGMERQRLVNRMEDQAAYGRNACVSYGVFLFDVMAMMAKDLKGYDAALAFLDGKDVARTDLAQAYRTLYTRRLAKIEMRERLSEEHGTKYGESTREKAFKQVENKIARYLDKEKNNG